MLPSEAGMVRPLLVSSNSRQNTGMVRRYPPIVAGDIKMQSAGAGHRDCKIVIDTSSFAAGLLGRLLAFSERRHRGRRRGEARRVGDLERFGGVLVLHDLGHDGLARAVEDGAVVDQELLRLAQL